MIARFLSMIARRCIAYAYLRIAITKSLSATKGCFFTSIGTQPLANCMAR